MTTIETPIPKRPPPAEADCGGSPALDQASTTVRKPGRGLQQPLHSAGAGLLLPSVMRRSRPHRLSTSVEYIVSHDRKGEVPS